MKLRKLLVVLLAILTVLALPAISAEAASYDSGKCGTNLTWNLSNGTLKIKGTGAMYDYKAASSTYGSSGASPWYQYAKEITAVIIEEGVTYIGDYAFYACSNLTDIHIPSSLTSIGDAAFIWIESVENIYITDLTAWCKIKSGESNDWLQNSSSLKNLYLNNELVTSLEIPSGVEFIPKDAFSRFGSFTSISVPETVSYLGSGAFAGCANVTDLSLPEGLKSIYSGGISGLGIETLTLPKSLRRMEQHDLPSVTKITFLGATELTWTISAKSLREIVFLGNAPVIYSTCFEYRWNPSFTAYYPACNKTWTIDKLMQYGGKITWTPLNNGAHSYVSGACEYCGAKAPLDSGTCGDNLTWVLSADGVLTISGSGAMGDYTNNAGYDNTFPWYDHKYQIKEVIIEEGVTSIDAHAFDSYDNIEKVSLPSTLTSIGDNAFLGINNLKTVSIANGLTTIGNYMFSTCYQLSSVNIPASVQTIGRCAFNGTALEGTLELPGVATIGEMAFISCSKLTDVVFGDSLKTISERAFEGCTGLTELVIPDSVETIGLGALYGCSGLQKLTVPFVGISKDSVPSAHTHHIGYIFGTGNYTGGYSADAAYANSNGTLTTKTYTLPSSLTELTVTGGELRQYALRDFKTLKTLYLGSNVSYLDKYVAQSCTALKEMHFAGNAPFIVNTAFTGRTFDAYYPCSDTTWDSVITSTYGGTVTWNAAHNFVNGTCENCGASEVTIIASGKCGTSATWTLDSNGLLTISGSGEIKGDKTFTSPFVDHANDITSVVIEDGITSVGSYAFYGCSNLSSADIPNSITFIGERAFQGCSTLPSIVIPDSITSVSSYTFLGCSSLVSIDIPNSVTSIGSCAFSGCSSLTTIDIPDTVTSVGVSAFYNCSGLTSIDLPNSVAFIGGSAFYNCTSLTSIDLPDSITSIEKTTFYGCTSLISVVIPEGVTSIGSSAFWECKKLASIDLPESITSIGSYAFYYCSSLSSIVIPNGVTSINTCTFANCHKLETLEIPNGVQTIGVEAFKYCSKLTSIVIPASVTSIEGHAFSNCSSLTSVDIPGSVTSVGDRAFFSCDSLTSLTISEGVQSIGESAFYGCDLTGTIHIPASVNNIGVSAFNGNDELSAIEVANENQHYYTDKCGVLLAKDNTQMVWVPRSITGTYEIPYGVTKIPNHAFYSCDELTGVVIPDTVTAIGYSAFQNCDRLQSIVIPKNVISIEERFLGYLSNVNEVTFLGAAPALNENAFYLNELTIHYPSNLPGWEEAIKSNYGAKSIDWIPYTAKIDLEGATMTLSNSLSMNFVVDMDLLPGSDYYAVITRTYADGSKEAVTVTCPQSEWNVYDADKNQKYFSYHGIAAKEMIDELTVTIYNADGTKASNVWTDSPRDYAMRAIDDEEKETEPNKEKLALYVDMLNYGAAAQTYFGYKTDDLANEGLSDAQKAYATTAEISVTSKQVKPGEGYKGGSLTLVNEIRLNFVFYTEFVSQDMYAVATYTDHYNNKKEVRIEGEDFKKESSNTLLISVTGMAVADYDQAVTCTVYGANGAVISATDSVACYVLRAKAAEADNPLFDTVLKFGYSAYKAFKK